MLSPPGLKFHAFHLEKVHNLPPIPGPTMSPIFQEVSITDTAKAYEEN